MLKAADHVMDRASERTGLSGQEVRRLRRQVERMDLAPGQTYYHEWPQRGFAVVAPARAGYPKHVVKTILAPWMSPPGERLQPMKTATISPQVLLFFRDDLLGEDKLASLGSRATGALIGGGIGAGGAALAQGGERKQDDLLRDLGHMSPEIAEQRSGRRLQRAAAVGLVGAGLGALAPTVARRSTAALHKKIDQVGAHVERAAQPTIKKVEESAGRLTGQVEEAANRAAGRAADEFEARAHKVVREAPKNVSEGMADQVKDTKHLSLWQRLSGRL